MPAPPADLGVHELTQRKHLLLEGNKVTDVGLESRIIDDTKLSDARLQHLVGLKQLRLLWLMNTRVTDEGVEKLRKALPACEIQR